MSQGKIIPKPQWFPNPTEFYTRKDSLKLFLVEVLFVVKYEQILSAL